MYRSKKPMKPKLTNRSIRYIIGELKKGKSTKMLSEEINVTQRHVQLLQAEYVRTKTIHIQRPAGRPKSNGPSDEEIKIVLDAHQLKPNGVVRTANLLKRDGHNTSRYRVYDIMKSNDLLVNSPAKSRKRKWIRFERLHSNAMWHTNWHIMKDPRMKGLNLIAYLDDSSRCVTGAALFKEATSENAVIAIRQAIGMFGVPATILSDNGSCFVGRGNCKKRTGIWAPTLFENELLNLKIGLINSRPYHPQTNGKLERFHRTIEEEIWHYDGLDDYVEYYNTDRLHFSLDMSNYETPMMAFHKRKATDEIRHQNHIWMEADIDD